MKISIIVPCYNIANSLCRCVDSILNQTFQDWELLLINDGSIDNTKNICDKYALLDSRIKVTHKNNEGVSSARNVGIRSALGEYITFIDADDYIDTNYLQKLLGNHQADFLICGFRNNKDLNFIPQASYFEGALFKANIQSLVEHEYILYAPWGKLFKRSLIEKFHLCFDTKLRFGEDTMFCYEYLFTCNNIEIVDFNGYFYDGEWGGGKKYVLTYDEVMYLDTKEILLLRQINKRFNCNIDLKYRGFHVSMLAGMYEKYTDIETYQMYCTTHKVIDARHFFNDSRLSYIFWGLVELEQNFQHLNRKDFMLFMYKLSRFMTYPTNLLSNYSLKMRILHWNIRHKLFNWNYVILYLLYKWKKL